MTFNKDEFWDSNYYNNPTLKDNMVDIAEKILKVKLPTLLVTILKAQNGGYTKGFAFPTTVKTSWADNHVPLDELFGIVTDKTFKTAHNILDTQYMIEEWGLPDKLVLLTGDGHWFIVLDYRKGDKPTITWFDTEMDQDIHIANSFEEFFEGLVSYETFEDNNEST